MEKLVNLIGIITILLCYQIDTAKSIGNIHDYITNQGYPAEKYEIKTKDGYLLDLYRIPGPGFNAVITVKETRKKVPVLLMHGLMGSADEFVAGGAGRGLAFNLADRNFDVFLANSRGSKYGFKHIALTPSRDPNFWDFCWDDTGRKDLPAIIKKVVKVSGQHKMHFIGYNQGNTAYFVMASTKPKYNHYIRKMIALGPMVFMQHAHHPMMSIIKARLETKWIDKHVGNSIFAPSDALKTDIQQDCTSRQIDYQVCDNFYYLTNGYSQYLNQTIVPDVFANTPYPASVKQILHFAQLLNTGNFVKYQDDETSFAVPYNLTAATPETHLLYVPTDYFCNTQDVANLAQHLPNVKSQFAFINYESNVDLILAKDNYDQVQSKIFNILL